MFASIHASDPDPKLLAYQYLQTLPQIAQGDANKLWIIPSEFSQALQGLSGLAGGGTGGEGQNTGASWLTEAAKSPPRSDRPYESLDTEEWFDSKLPPARLQPEAEIRASDRDAQTADAHANLSYDEDPAPEPEPRREETPRALPPSPPQYSGPPSDQQQPQRYSSYPGQGQGPYGQQPVPRLRGPAAQPRLSLTSRQGPRHHRWRGLCYSQKSTKPSFEIRRIRREQRCG